MLLFPLDLFFYTYSGFNSTLYWSPSILWIFHEWHLLCFIEHYWNWTSFNVELQRIWDEPIIITCLWWSDYPDLILEPLCKPLIKARCYCLHICAIPFLHFFVTVCTRVPFLILLHFCYCLKRQCHSFSCTSLSSFAHTSAIPFLLYFFVCYCLLTDGIMFLLLMM